MSRSLPERQNAVNQSRRSRRSSKRTPAGDAVSIFAITVLRLSGLLTAAGDALARPVGQTSARWLVMAAVEDAPATVAQIARMLGLTRQSAQRTADLLAADGLATYAENPGHRRAKLVTLTPSGRRILGKIQVAQRAWADELGEKLREQDLRKANEVLARALTTLSQRR